MRKYHCSRSRFSTVVPQRQQRRSTPDDLLARQDDLVLRAPVDGAHGLVGQPGLEELQEQPLLPAVVLGVAGDDLARPVEAGAHEPHLAAHVVDVAVRPHGRMNAAVDGGVLGRQAEAVEAHREQDVESLHPTHPREDVRPGHGIPVTDVQVAGRVGIHRQDVALLARVVVTRDVQLVGLPAVAPLLLERGRVESLGSPAAASGSRWSSVASLIGEPGHQQLVAILVVGSVLLAAHALAHEAAVLVDGDRPLVVGEHAE